MDESNLFVKNKKKNWKHNKAERIISENIGTELAKKKAWC